MDSKLNTIGAALLGLVTVALAWLWARQERETMDMLRALLHQCEERNDLMNDSVVRVYEQYHKAISNVTHAETMNYQYIQQHQQDRKTIASLERRLAAAAGRSPSRSDDRDAP
jgi:hypothetical protein